MEPRLRFNLDELLKQNKLKASDLSKLTGIPKQTLSEWRSGLVPKSILSLKKVANTFGVSLDELVFRAAHELIRKPERDSLAPGTPAPPSLLTNLGACQATRQEAVVGLTKNGIPLFVSAAFQERLGWPEELLLKRSLFEFLLQADGEPVDKALAEALGSGQPSWVNCRLLCHDLKILPQRCLFVPLSSGEAVLVIFYKDAGDASPSAKPRLPDSFDQLAPVELPLLLAGVRENFQRLRPGSILQFSELPLKKPYITRPNSLAQLIFSALQELASLTPPAISPAGQVFEVVAYEDEQVLELCLRGPSFSPLDSSNAELAHDRLLSLVPSLAPAVGAQVEWKNWGSFWQVRVAFPEAPLRL